METNVQQTNETLELRSNNLYRTGALVQLTEGEEILTRTELETVGTIEDFYHTVRENDRLDVLAWKYYGKRVEDASKYWWIIADANKIQNPLDLTAWVGKSLLVPNINNALLKI